MDVSVQWGFADVAVSKLMSRIEPAGIAWYMYRSLRLGDDASVAIGYVRWVFAFVVDGIAFGFGPSNPAYNSKIIETVLEGKKYSTRQATMG
jgi:hypothetical protein